MDPYEEPGQRRIVSIPSLTAWLSLCILAAAWGRSLDERWQPIWADIGAYGLAASVGLSFLERARLAHHKWSQVRAIRARTECGLARLNEHGAVLDSINTAIRRLQNCASRNSSALPATPTSWRVRASVRSRWLASLAMNVTPIVEQGDEQFERALGVRGTLRQISARGLSFCHTQAFPGRIAVLTFELDDGPPLSFVVEVQRTEVSPEGFLTHGAILEVGVPAPQPAEGEQEELAVGCTA
jgi:hypothetical protein